MKFIVDNGGQTCNKFWSYLAPLHYAYYNKKKLYVIYPDKDLSSYPNLTNNSYLYFPLYIPVLYKFIKPVLWEKICRVIIGKFFHIPSIIKICSSKNLWNSWHGHKDIDIENLRPLVKNIFKPNLKIETLVSKTFDEKRSIYDVIIGLHIRRGDYKQWQNGKFYYSDTEYLQCCQRILDMLQGKKVIFFIASTDVISELSFIGINFFQIKNANGPTDLFALSQCDYIFGPPSTFSNWAAFYGNRPIKFIESIDSFNPLLLQSKKYVYPTWEGDCN